MASTESPESATSLSKCDLDSGVLLSSSIARPVIEPEVIHPAHLMNLTLIFKRAGGTQLSQVVQRLAASQTPDGLCVKQCELKHRLGPALGVSLIAQSTLDGNAVASVGSEVIGASSSLQAEAEQIGRLEGEYHLAALASVKDRSACLALYLF
jgi:hypothetical protein